MAPSDRAATGGTQPAISAVGPGGVVAAEYVESAVVEPGPPRPFARDPTTIAVGLAVGLALGFALLLALRRRGRRRKAQRARERIATQRLRPLPTGNADTRERLRREHDLLSFFVNFPEQVKALNSSLDLAEVASVVGAACESMLGTRVVTVFLLDPPRRELRLLHARAPGVPPQPFRDARVSAGLTPQDWLLGQLRPILGREVASRFPAPGAAIEVHGHLFPFQVATPVLLRGEVRGLITAGGMNAPDEHAMKILTCIANVAAISLENATLMEKARHLANTDRMTELYNHAYFQHQLAREVEQARARGTELAVFLLDVDHFKAYNDREGHPAGDALLKHLAQLLAGSVREGDLVARYGGEEFVVLMPRTSEKNAVGVADKIRRRVEAHRFLGSDKQPLGAITVSGGIATLDPTAPSAADLVKRADVALYRAKQLGRNRVQTFVAEFELDRRSGADRRRVDTTGVARLPRPRTTRPRTGPVNRPGGEGTPGSGAAPRRLPRTSTDDVDVSH